MSLNALRERLKPWLYGRNTARSTVLYCLANLMLLGVIWALQACALNTPEVLPLYAPEPLLIAHRAVKALMGWLAVLGTIAWWQRDTAEPDEGRWLAHAAVTPALLLPMALWVGYGMLDTPMAMVVVEALVIARALFDLRIMVPGMLLGAAMVGTSLVLLSMGVLKPSSLLSAPVFTGEQPAAWWKALALVFNISVMPFLLVLVILFRSFSNHRRELENLARTDMLTGLINRREFMTRLKQEAHRHERSGEPAAIIMIDIDHFKQVNDLHGHPTGDAVLERVGHLLRDGIRQHIDVAARMGGEEFAVLLPETDIEGAKVVAAKLCKALREERFEHQGQAFQVTLSAGVAPLDQGQADAALRLADDRLYRAKAQGRDRVVTALD